MTDIFQEQEFNEVDAMALIELLNLGAMNLKEATGFIVEKYVAEIPDQQTLEALLTEVGQAVLRSANLDMPLTVKVAFQ